VIGTTYEVLVTREIAADVQRYIDQIRLLAEGHELQVEQQVDYGRHIGVEGQFGTADAIVTTSDGEIQIRDLKFGRGEKVFAERNEQLQIYALGAVRDLEELGFEFNTIRVGIHQPRLDHLDEWVFTPAELAEFELELKAAIERASAPDAPRVPGNKQCRWCKHKANCPEATGLVQDVVGVDFENLDQPIVPKTPELLAKKMEALDFIEEWCSAVRAAVETELLAGRTVPGWKLVEGKKGARAWADEAAAEDLLRKKFRLTIEEAFNLKLISPTQAEKVLKDSPRRWAQLQPLVTQNGGKPSVAPASDKRPEYTVANDFDNLTPKE
jgi:hypothetical protein